MQVVSFTQLRTNLKKILDTTADQFEPTVISRSRGEDMVLISLREYESLKETAYLLGNAANAKHLRKSIASFKKGKVITKKLIEE